MKDFLQIFLDPRQTNLDPQQTNLDPKQYDSDPHKNDPDSQHCTYSTSRSILHQVGDDDSSAKFGHSPRAD